MSTKIKALFCLFLVGILVGACGRKFRAMDENKTIEARADLLAKLHFSAFFDDDGKYQRHVKLSQELLAVEFITSTEQGGIAISTREKDCTSADLGVTQYTNDQVLASAEPGKSIRIPGQNNYGFHAVCIPTTQGNREQCAHFLVAVQKRYEQGIGTALVVVGLDPQTNNWRNLQMSSNFKYAVNPVTFDQLKASFACAEDDQRPNFQIPQGIQGQQGQQGQQGGERPGLLDTVLQVGLLWGANELEERFDIDIFGLGGNSGGTTPPIIPPNQQESSPAPTPTTPTTQPDWDVSAPPGQFDNYPQNSGGGYDTWSYPSADTIFDPSMDTQPNPFGDPNELEDANSDWDNYCYETGTC